jgi:threonine dehydrogenase-like Zn-dependent dehydrogenase
MRAVAVLPSTREVKLIDAEEPRLSEPTHVEVRILEVGICGTDREISTFQYGTPPPDDDHLVIGHESLAEVTEVGGAVADLKRGDLVVPMVRRPCPHATCLACLEGRPDFCFTGDYRERGIKEAHGFMAERVVDHERYMNLVPRALREVAVLVEPLTIAEKALEQVWDVQGRLPWVRDLRGGEPRGAGLCALVLGAGAVGLLGAMALRAAGFETLVYAREPAPNPKAKVVEGIGGRYADSATSTLDDVARSLGNVDLIYEATGASGVSFEAMKVLGTNGVFVFTGVPGRKAPISIDADLIMRNLVLKNQVILGTVNAGRQAFQDAIRDLAVFAARWPNPLRALITGRFPLTAHADLLLGKPTGIKNVLAFA